MTHDHFTLTFIAASLLLGVFAIVIVTSMLRQYRERQQLHAELQNARLQEAERVMNQLSKEIHDDLGQTASLMRMNLRLAESFELPDDKQEIITTLSQLASKMVNATRSISHSLNSDLVQLQGLENAIRDELRFVEASKLLRTNLAVNGYGELGADRDLLVYRIFQEALQNTIKHGKATLLNIRLDYGAELLVLSLKDNGVGYTPGLEKAGIGISNMLERAKMLQASIDINTAPGKGCMVTLVVPLNIATAKSKKHDTI